MDRLHTYLQLSLADFRERTRRSSFLVTLLGVLFFGYLVITGKYTIQFGEYRPVYDSAWAGTAMAVCGSIMLSLVGFYLVRGSIKRDQRTEVGQIIAATPMSRREYMVSKLVSNTIVLWFMIAILAVVAFLTLLIRDESGHIDLADFITPFLIIALPAMLFVASVTVFFDTARWLRGSAGNIIYLFLAEFCIVFGMLNFPLLDLGGVSVFTDSVRAAAAAAYPGESIGLLMGFVMFDPYMQAEGSKAFAWGGIDWSMQMLLLRSFWVGAAVVVTAAAVPLFDRFDPARYRHRTKAKKTSPASVPTPEETTTTRRESAYTELMAPQFSFSLLRITLAELRLALKGYHWFWYAVAAGLIVAQVAAPFDIARQYLTPAAMVWPLVIWSSMGTREYQHGTTLLMFSSPSPVSRQLPAQWLSGLTVAVAAVAGMLVRSIASGQHSYAAALAVGAVLVPSAALAFGTLSRSRRLFEVVYLTFWYVGSIEHLSAIDLLGTTDASITAGRLVTLSILAICLTTVAFVSRKVQLSRT